MNFNSWEFFVFFPVVTALYFALTSRIRNEARANAIARFFLLAASLFFYACWKPAYLGLIIFSVIVTWLSGLLMDGRTAAKKRLVLAASLIINLGILFFFKYYGFLAESVRFISADVFAMPAFNFLLPVGISFYTFQALGYSIDVYHGRVRAERNLSNYALFVTFFPQLVAGPIERTANLLPQFKVNHHFDYDRVTAGLRLAAWGMFKKVVVADELAVYVNGVYGNPQVYPAASLALATVFFAFQIYCDFSGYSDIAIGCARILGFNLMTNFRQPYFACSITDFWRRWHISLSTWLKDYLYIPLGGNRKGVVRQKTNLLVTFLLSGLWHGAAWHFVVWGALHGVFQIAERGINTMKKAGGGGANRGGWFCRSLKTIFTFVLVCFAWIFFRARTIPDAFLIITKTASLPTEIVEYVRALPQNGITNTIRAAFQLSGHNAAAHPIEGFGITKLAASLLCIAVLLLFDICAQNKNDWWAAQKPLLRWTGYYAVVIAILLTVLNNRLDNVSIEQFIYFTF